MGQTRTASGAETGTAERTAPAVAALTPAERVLRTLLRVLGGFLFAAALVYALGPLVGPAQGFLREPPFVSNSAVKVSLLALASIYAAGDIRRRQGLVAIIIAAHLVSVAAMGSMLAFADTGGVADIGIGHPTVKTMLIGAIGLDGVITAAIAIAFLAARASARGRHVAEVREEPSTAAEKTLRIVLLVLTGLFVLGAAAYELGPLLDSSKTFARELPFVTNSVVKVATLAMLCAYAAYDLRRNMAIVVPVIAAHFVSIVVSAVYLILLRPLDYRVPLLGGNPRMSDVEWGALALDTVIGVVVLLTLSLRAWSARYGLKFLRPAEYRVLIALAEALIPDPEALVPPERVARNVEAYLQGVRAHRRWIYRGCLFLVQLRPMLTLHPPLSEMEPHERRRFLETRFQSAPSWPRVFKHFTQIVIRVCQQLTYAGYYNDPGSWPSIGYQRFADRPRYAALKVTEPGPHPLQVDRPENVGASELEADVCIIGSGAGGSTLAYELASAGHHVLILERGQYVEPRHFNDDEAEMIGKLYADGVMQQSKDFRFTVLQGSCVGGSTTVNNAVCFRPPDAVVARWNSEHDAGIDPAELKRCVEAVEAFLPVTSQTAAPLNPSGEKYVAGAVKLGVSPGRLAVDAVRANITGCYGSGYCNIGCKWGKKLSMLDTLLPWAQRDFPGRVRIVSDCEVERIFALSGTPKRVTSVRAALPDGRHVTVRAKKFVLSAGAVGSSYIMLRSGVGNGLPVGKQLCFNMGAPLTAEFDGPPLNAYDGLQISHYGVPHEAEGFVFETWFNPPVAQALNMPGWFEQHFENMRRYDHMMAVGVLVGTAGNGSVKKALLGGPDIDFTPTAKDLATLSTGLRLLGEILFEAGAKRVMVNTWGYDEFTRREDLDQLDRITKDPDYITLGTGHPQGGNALSRDPRRGVVDPEAFNVHGYDNLHVCDASLIPSSLTVNPQLTVMSLARYAAPRIAAGL